MESKLYTLSMLITLTLYAFCLRVSHLVLTCGRRKALRRNEAVQVPSSFELGVSRTGNSSSPTNGRRTQSPTVEIHIFQDPHNTVDQDEGKPYHYALPVPGMRSLDGHKVPEKARGEGRDKIRTVF